MVLFKQRTIKNERNVLRHAIVQIVRGTQTDAFFLIDTI